MAKILLIEDDAVLAAHLKDALSKYKHHVDHVADGNDGLYWLTSQPYSVVIVDWNLPGIDGTEICKRYRQKGGTTPILMLTGRNTDSEIVVGLDAGADDYLPKPFTLDVLKARLRALLRRQPSIEPNRIVNGELELDLVTSEAFINGQLVKLTRKEYAILELLVKEEGKFLTVEAMLDRIWPSGTEVSPEVIRSHINRLKNRLAALSPTAAEMIKTSYGMGYRIQRPQSE
jgi:DNA-binding response OmpR family regulator